MSCVVLLLTLPYIKKHAKIMSQTCETVELPVITPNARRRYYFRFHMYLKITFTDMYSTVFYRYLFVKGRKSFTCSVLLDLGYRSS